MNCPCGNPNPYEQCCEPYHKGTKQADTAEALMRARYSAFAKADVDYILSTVNPDSREENDRESTHAWASKSEWLGFELLDVQDGGADDEAGKIEFNARYRISGNEYCHHEVATFEKVDGKWFFMEGEVAGGETFKRTSVKVGRNDPCPCGSGKKYKKCCMSASLSD